MTIKSNSLGLTGYRLPTVTEWRYACRAGTVSAYHFGEPISLLGRYGHFGATRRHPVESLLPNEAGLFDMHGNVRELTHGPLSATASTDTGRRVLCGGAYGNLPRLLQSDGGLITDANQRKHTIGFRVARTHR